MMARVTDIDSLYDFIGYVVLCAPDQFPSRDYLPPEDQMTLEKAFSELRGALALIDREVTSVSKREALLSLLDRSMAAYQNREAVKGAHLLQDFQDLIFARKE